MVFLYLFMMKSSLPITLINLPQYFGNNSFFPALATFLFVGEPLVAKRNSLLLNVNVECSLTKHQCGAAYLKNQKLTLTKKNVTLEYLQRIFSTRVVVEILEMSRCQTAWEKYHRCRYLWFLSLKL